MYADFISKWIPCTIESKICEDNMQIGYGVRFKLCPT